MELEWDGMHEQGQAGDGKSQDRCLVRVVADVLEEEPALEAVSVDRRHEAVSIATLGQVDEEALKRKIQEKLSELGEHSEACGLLDSSRGCEDCAVRPTPAILNRIEVRHDGCSTTVSRKTCPTAPRFWKWHRLPWPRFKQRLFEPFRDVEEEGMEEEEWRKQLWAAAVCGGAGLLGALGTGSSVGVLAYGVAYVAGGWFAVGEALERWRERSIDVHFLMLAVALGSAAIGAWGEGATLLFLFSLSGALEHYAMGRTRREIRSLFRAAPKRAVVVDSSGSESEHLVSCLRPGMTVRVRAGGLFPADGRVVAGVTSVDESTLTGESVPVSKNRGDLVFAGTLNLMGMVDVALERGPSESALERIIRLIQEAQKRKAPTQRFAEAFSGVYTWVALGLAGGMFFVWWLGMGKPAFAGGGQSAFYRTMALLVVASPCALVLSIPSAVLAAIAGAARRGILFRGGAAVEKLAEIQLVALDKTGTLTTGELSVEKVELMEGDVTSERILRTAFDVDTTSSHPLARAIVRHGRRQGWEPVAFEESESVPGCGMRARRGSEWYWTGSKSWVLRETKRAGERWAAPSPWGRTEVWVAGPGFLGRLELRDEVRGSSKGVVESLRNRGLRTVVLTGDRAEAAEMLRGQVAVDEVRAALSPEQKVESIRQWREKGIKVAMVGDGVNDAPSLASAHVGVAMGARGSDAALEQADLVLMHDRLEAFVEAHALSKRARRIIRQNVVVSMGTVLVLAGFAVAGSIPLTLGVVGHEGSTVLVVLNSLRLLFHRD